MASTIKLKPKARKGVIDIKTLIKHPMETGLRKNPKTGKIYPAHHITDLTIEINGNKVASGLISGAISKNPYFRFKAPGKKGDTVKVSYMDNQGKSDSATKQSK